MGVRRQFFTHSALILGEKLAAAAGPPLQMTDFGPAAWGQAALPEVAGRADARVAGRFVEQQ
jgi:hypothetical protein